MRSSSKLAGGFYYFRSNPTIKFSSGGHGILGPDWLRKAILFNGVSFEAFLNQATVAEGSFKKLKEVTEEIKRVSNKVLEKIREAGLLSQVLPILQYYKKVKRTGKLPNRNISYPDLNAQAKISDIIVDTLNEKSNEPGMFGIFEINRSYDMQAGIGNLGACLVTCMYYAAIARKFGLEAELYHVPNHAIIGLTVGRNLKFVDPTMNLKTVELGIICFDEEGKKTEGSKTSFCIDYRKPQRTGYFGLSAAWVNKGYSTIRQARLVFGEPDMRLAFENAVDAFDKALEIDPENVGAWGSKGDALRHIGYLEKNPKKRKEFFVGALEAYNKALGLDKKCVSIGRGYALLELGQVWDAHKSFETALSFYPGNIYALKGSGKAFLSLGVQETDSRKRENYFRLALKMLYPVAERKPHYPEVWGLLYDVFSGLGRKKEAGEAHKKEENLKKQCKPYYLDEWEFL